MRLRTVCFVNNSKAPLSVTGGAGCWLLLPFHRFVCVCVWYFLVAIQKLVCWTVSCLVVSVFLFVYRFFMMLSSLLLLFHQYKYSICFPYVVLSSLVLLSSLVRSHCHMHVHTGTDICVWLCRCDSFCFSYFSWAHHFMSESRVKVIKWRFISLIQMGTHGWARVRERKKEDEEMILNECEDSPKSHSLTQFA